MLTRTENIVILIVMMVGSMLFMTVLNRVWPREKRREHNDLIGWQLGILGTTYAVILGFMLYTVWTTFGAAELNADLEANALRNVYRLAEGLPDEQRAVLEKQARAYADAVVENDWPEMAQNLIPERSHLINQAMWRTLMSVRLATPSEITAEDHAISELSSLTEHRRTRLLQSNYRLPTIFWCVLLVGGAVTILSASMFGSINARLHTLQVFCFTLLITLVLLAIADVNLPFRGWVHVSNFAFKRAQQNMNE
jgi:ABC-type multidrug transport system fused ATPase/permease subunit